MAKSAQKMGAVSRVFAGFFGVLGVAVLLPFAVVSPFSTGWIVALTVGPLSGWFLESARTGNPQPWLAGLWIPIFYFVIAAAMYAGSEFYPDSSSALTGAFIIGLVVALAVCVGIYRAMTPRFDVKTRVEENPVRDAEQVDFRLPMEAIVKQFKGVALGSVVVVLMLPLLGAPYFSSNFWWVVGFSLVLDVTLLLFTRQYVYITLSPEGFFAKGMSRKSKLFSWSDPVLVEEKTMSGWQGIMIRRQGAGFMSDFVHKVFVPRPVFMQEAFQDAVSQYAPSAHPLRRISRYGG